MKRWWSAALLGSLGFLPGCDSPPPAVEIPKFNPAEASAKALADYDANKDGSLDKKELEKVPGILRHMDIWDTDNDGKVSGVEIQARVAKYVSQGTGIMGYICQITLDGKPLEGADVLFTPEPFLGPLLKPGTSKTGFDGTASPSIAKADLPEGQTDISGMRNGVYKIEVTHPTKKIPDRYNTKTTLGVEVSIEASGRSGIVAIPLKSS